MMRSLYSGVAGLKTHQTKMDVIGNNIANVNTTAYKSSSIVFQDLMSQTTQAASGANAATGTGGTNARQIGLGVKSGAITMKIDSQGSAQSTGNPFDIMITGDNFFVVNNGTGNYFTRDGSFYVDGAGNLAMTSTGYNVMGWQAEKVDGKETGNITKDTVSALRIMSLENMTYGAEWTQNATVSGIVDKLDPDLNNSNGKTINLNFYDNIGYSYTARLTLNKSVGEGQNGTQYSVELTDVLDSEGKSVIGSDIDISSIGLGGATTQQITKNIALVDGYAWNGSNLEYTDAEGNKNVVYTVGTAQQTDEALEALAKAYNTTVDVLQNYGTYDTTNKTVTSFLDATGNIQNSFKVTDEGGNSVYPTSVDFSGRRYTGSTLYFNPENGTFAGIGSNSVDSKTSVLALSGLGPSFTDITVDFSTTAMSNNNGTSTVNATSGDLTGIGSGRKLGEMIGVSIQQNGMIYASYDNGMTRLLGQIATANFPNASGLQKEGDNMYSATMNSGEFDGIGVDVTASGGYMSTGQLEMSNVDLSSEFTEMITTQRGFQANSRIITVSDTLLEELTNLKR